MGDCVRNREKNVVSDHLNLSDGPIRRKKEQREGTWMKQWRDCPAFVSQLVEEMSGPYRKERSGGGVTRGGYRSPNLSNKEQQTHRKERIDATLRHFVMETTSVW